MDDSDNSLIGMLSWSPTGSYPRKRLGMWFPFPKDHQTPMTNPSMQSSNTTKIITSPVGLKLFPSFSFSLSSSRSAPTSTSTSFCTISWCGAIPLIRIPPGGSVGSVGSGGSVGSVGSGGSVGPAVVVTCVVVAIVVVKITLLVVVFSPVVGGTAVVVVSGAEETVVSLVVAALVVVTLSLVVLPLVLEDMVLVTVVSGTFDVICFVVDEEVVERAGVFRVEGQPEVTAVGWAVDGCAVEDHLPVVTFSVVGFHVVDTLVDG